MGVYPNISCSSSRYWYATLNPCGHLKSKSSFPRFAWLCMWTSILYFTIINSTRNYSPLMCNYFSLFYYSMRKSILFLFLIDWRARLTLKQLLYALTHNLSHLLLEANFFIFPLRVSNSKSIFLFLKILWKFLFFNFKSVTQIETFYFQLRVSNSKVGENVKPLSLWLEI